MSITNVLIKLGGGVLALVGFCLVLTALGVVTFVPVFMTPVISIIVGIIVIGFGVYIVRGGTPTV
jgi:hypothetical protein